jgi:SAM-dependent methyltransferase
VDPDEDKGAVTRVETSDLLSAQQAYYRAAATEYDSAYGDDGGPLRMAARAFDFVGVHGDAVELACGTGQWSRLLEPRVATLTCLDGARETIAIARTRVSPRVEFITGDIFHWAPARQFDTVFFAFWLSHVPWSLWPSFWTSLASMIPPGGVVGVVDETDEGVSDKERWTAEPDCAARQLSDGREYTVVKLRLDPVDVVARLAALGWRAEIDAFYPGMFALRARRSFDDATERSS